MSNQNPPILSVCRATMELSKNYSFKLNKNVLSPFFAFRGILMISPHLRQRLRFVRVEFTLTFARRAKSVAVQDP